MSGTRLPLRRWLLAAITVVSITASARAAELTAHQRQACAQYLSVPNIDPSILRQCLEAVRRAEAQAAMLEDMKAIPSEIDSRQCPCAEAGIDFVHEDLAMSECRKSYAALRNQEIGVARGLITDEYLQGAKDRFASCVANAHERRARDDEVRRAAYVAADEEKRMRLLVVSARDNPDIMQVVTSTKLCDAKGERADTLRKIADEKKYARQVGVVNLSDLEDLKQELRDEDERIAGAAAALKQTRRSPLRCDDKRISELRACLDEEPPENCSDDSPRVRVTLFREH